MNSKLISLLVLIAALAGCIDASISEEDICKTTTLDVPPFTVDEMSLSFDKDLDVSDLLTDVSSVSSNPTLNITKLDVSSDQELSWISSITILIQDKSKTLSQVVLAQYAATNQSSVKSFNLDIVLGSDNLFKYLKKSARLTYIISGRAPSIKNNLINTTCINIHGKLNKIP